MELFEALSRRRSVRRYLPDPVPDAHINTILQAANTAPSAMNHKPWEFLVVSGGKIQEMGLSFGSVLDRFREIRGEELSEEVITFGRTYGNAPVVIVVLCTTSSRPNFQRAYLESASAAMENLLLAVTALGLGTCWMTGPLEDEPGLRRILGIRENRTIVAGTPLGYPAKLTDPHLDYDPELESKIHRVL